MLIIISMRFWLASLNFWIMCCALVPITIIGKMRLCRYWLRWYWVTVILLPLIQFLNSIQNICTYPLTPFNELQTEETNRTVIFENINKSIYTVLEHSNNAKWKQNKRYMNIPKLNNILIILFLLVVRNVIVLPIRAFRCCQWSVK